MVDYAEGEAEEVTMHDGSKIILKKLERDYDPCNRPEAMRLLEEANAKQWLLTGLIYINPEQPSLMDIYNLTDTPLNRLSEDRLRPAPESIAKVNAMMF
jgi:2-oxoglutarate ferredoxin oxidoreductase subunit beta